MITFSQAYDYIQKTDSTEVRALFYAALMEKKVDYVDLSNAYVEYLQDKKEDNLEKLIEAETCVYESLAYDTIDKEKEHRSIQRRLYLLNQGHRMNMSNLNEKYSYIGDEKAKEFSWYENNKEWRK